MSWSGPGSFTHQPLDVTLSSFGHEHYTDCCITRTTFPISHCITRSPDLSVTAASHQQSHLHLIYRLSYKPLTPSVQGEVLFSPVWHFRAFSLFVPAVYYLGLFVLPVILCRLPLWPLLLFLDFVYADCCLPRSLPGIRLCLWIICVIPDAGDWSLFVSDIELIKNCKLIRSPLTSHYNYMPSH